MDPPAYYSDGLFVSYDLTPIQDPPGYNEWTKSEVRQRVQPQLSQLSQLCAATAIAGLPCVGRGRLPKGSAVTTVFLPLVVAVNTVTPLQRSLSDSHFSLRKRVSSFFP